MTDNLAENRKARFHHEVLETFEAGIALKGTEVKSCRAHKVSLQEAFGRIEAGEAWLYQCHIAPYEKGNVHNHDPVRPRKLLLHRAELDRLAGRLATERLALVPLRLYLKKGRVKVLLGLAKGRRGPDKREAIRRREARRSAEREIVERR
jgi:SsrA-binding protein